ncbi:MAG: hypothetical protein J0H40_03980 [Rhizobiales bacterium]|nr:hypothetical protein [Hyphomicrobiales bacterium]
MASKSFSVRISLDGGADIKKQLEAIGTAGKKAFEQLESASQASSFADRLSTSLNGLQAKAQLVRAEIDKSREAFGNLKSALGEVALKVGAVTAAFSAAAVGVGAFVKGSADNQKSIQDAADAAGINTKQFTDLKNAFALGGVSGEDFTKAIGGVSRALDDSSKRNAQYNHSVRDLQRGLNLGHIDIDQYYDRLTQLRQGAADSQDAFTRLGISTKNLDGSLKKPNEILQDIADAFQHLPDGASKAALSMELFQSKSTSLVGFLNKGSKGIADLTLEAERIAPPLDALGKRNLLAVSTAFDKLSSAARSAKDSIAATIAPVVTQAINGFTEAIVRNRTSLVLLAASITEKVKPIVADLVAVLEGRDADVKNDFILKAKQSVLDFGNAVSSAVTNIIVPAFNALLGILDTVAKGINAIFGTNLTGGEIAAAAVVLQLVSAFTLLGSTISTIVTVVGGLIAVFGTTTLGLIALGVAIGGFIVSTSLKLGSISDVAAAVGQAISDAFTGAFNFVGSLFDGFVQAINAVWDAVKAGATDVATWIVDQFNSAVSTVKDYLDALVNWAMAALAPVINAAKAIGSAVNGATSAVGFAEGGPVRGPGTGTSDSIAARLSNGEYVMPKSAVDFFGLPFMEAVRKRAASLRDAFAGLGPGIVSALTPSVPRFANGGLVSAAALAGNSGDLRPAHIHMPGGSFPVMAAPDVIESLMRYAADKQVRSAGRKPTWYRG